MQKIETDSLWVAGDFNIALKQTDIIAGSPHPEREVATFIKTLANFDIYDIWRINHSESKDYTWSRSTPFTARRIDYRFCDSVSLTKITTTSIETVSHSDHKLVKAQVNMNNFKRGLEYWKHNTSLLTETDFQSGANAFIDAHFHEYQNDNPDIAWKMFKLTSFFFCLDYTNNRSKNRTRNRN